MITSYDHLRGYISAIRTFVRDHMNTQNRNKQIILQTLILSGASLSLLHLAQAQGYERGYVEKVESAVQAVATVNAHGRYQPSWESIKQYKVPDWYQDAKFGIFI